MLKVDETTLIEEEEKDLLRIALKQIFGADVKNDLVLHYSKYSFLASSENFDEFDLKYFSDRLNGMAEKSEKQLHKEIAQQTIDAKALQTARANVIAEHSLPDDLVHLLDVARIYSHQRMFIRIAWTKAINVWGRILREFARRLHISETQVQYLLREELNEIFTEDKPMNMKEIEERMNFCIFVILNRQKPVLLTGQEALDFEEGHLKQELLSKDSVKGTIANRGYAKGKVKVLRYGKNMVKQIEEMEHGDILVTGNTRPDMILALKKASAVVTDEGGICSHAALVSREFGIPCIVATKDAQKIFKDGDMVEVDANKGIVKKIKN